MPSTRPDARTTPAARAETARSAGPAGVLAGRRGVSTGTVREGRERGPADRRDRSGRPREPPREASGEGRAVVRAPRRAAGFPLGDLAFVVRHVRPHLGRDDVHRILGAEGPGRRPAPAKPETPAGKSEGHEPGFVRVGVRHPPEPRTADGELRKRCLLVATGRRSRPVRLAVKDEETGAAAEALLGEALAAFPFRVTRPPTDRGSCFTAEGFGGRCRGLGAERRETGPCAPRTSGMVGRFGGRAQRGVLGVTVAGRRDLGRLLAGFDRARDARRRRVPGGKSPAEIVKERLRQDRGLADAGCRPPSDPCALPRVVLVVGRAEDVSRPDC